MTQHQALLEIAALVAGALGRHVAPTVAKHARKTTARIRPRKPAAPSLRFPAFGVDYAYGRPNPKKLYAAGVRWVGRYLSPDPAKNLTRAESAGLAAAGIKRVLVWESTANRALDGIDAGIADARQALHQANVLGAPLEAVIYFAIDFDATGPDVKPYFEGVRSVLGNRAGAYGGYTALAYLRDQRIVEKVWQTYAWSGGRWLDGAQLLQYDNGRDMFGVSVDFDHAISPDCGWW